MSGLEFVQSLAEVEENIREYQKGASIRATPSQVLHWDYLPHTNQAGPSRFIGFKGMTAERYDANVERDPQGSRLHGTRTQAALRKLGCFVELRPGDAHYQHEKNAAVGLLERGKSLHPKARFYVPSLTAPPLRTS